VGFHAHVLRRSGLSGLFDVEEVVFQARVLLKKRVVEESGCQDCEHSLYVRELLGIVFPRCTLPRVGEACGE